MDKGRVLACLLAADLVVAGGVAVARTDRGTDRATLVAAPLDDAPFGNDAETSPLPTPTAAPTVAVPSPSVSLPPLPSLPVTLPPLPSVSLPPLPTVSVPPLLCPEDLGADELPAVAHRVDIRKDLGQPRGLVAGAGRLWFSVMDGAGSPHLTGIDPRNGGRLVIATPNRTHVLAVAAARVWAVEETTFSVVVFDAANGHELRRFGPDDVAHDGQALHVMAAAAGTDGGGWLLGSPTGGDDNYRAVVRVRADGTVAWSTRLPDSASFGWTVGRGASIAAHGDSAYVAFARPRSTAFWRVGPSGEVAARSAVATASPFAGDVLLAATSDGLYALVHPDGLTDARVTRLHPNDLRLLGAKHVDEAYDLFADENAVYVIGQVCSFLLSRYDPVTLARTGFWRKDRPDEGTSGAVSNGLLWTLYEYEGAPRALHRHDLS